MSRSKLGFKNKVVKISAENLGRVLDKEPSNKDILNLAALFHAGFGTIKGKVNLLALFRELNALPKPSGQNTYGKYLKVFINYVLYSLGLREK